MNESEISPIVAIVGIIIIGIIWMWMMHVITRDAIKSLEDE